MSYQNSDTISVENSPNNTKAANPSIMSTLSSLVPMMLIFGVFYFLVIRPQEKKRKQHIEMLNTVSIGEEVLLTSGIYGIVTKRSDNILKVEIAKDTVIKISKDAISDITSRVNNTKLVDNKTLKKL